MYARQAARDSHLVALRLEYIPYLHGSLVLIHTTTDGYEYARCHTCPLVTGLTTGEYLWRRSLDLSTPSRCDSSVGTPLPPEIWHFPEMLVLKIFEVTKAIGAVIRSQGLFAGESILMLAGNFNFRVEPRLYAAALWLREVVVCYRYHAQKGSQRCDWTWTRRLRIC